jgi:FtsP/CotA-like multicopper oxidase with cupredoxin domain
MKNSGRKQWLVLALVLILAGTGAVAARASATEQPAPSSHVRTYYIAADEVEWDYAPSGINQVTGKPFDRRQRVVTESGPHRIGRKYHKVLYREYTDATFSTRKPRPAGEAYLGILGPLIHAEVGDTIRVVFRNNASRPYSVHPHGVFYEKASEGVSYNDGSAAAGKANGAVPPGTTWTYTWEVPERAGPGPNDPSSVAWLYHSHVEEEKDVDSGLVGAIIVTRRGMARPDGTPKDVNREFVCLFNIFDENQSWYLDRNIQDYTGDPKGTKKTELIPFDTDGVFSLNGTGFADSNMKSTINGYLYGNGPRMTMKRGEHVRWYTLAIGFGFNFHTPHWHGNTVVMGGQRMDVILLGPAQSLTADMVPDAAGIWMFHCHVSDHMNGGMITLYQVKP